MKWVLIQFLVFQALWFIAVLGGNQWLVAAALLLALHFWLTPSRAADWRVLPIALLGIMLDSVLTLVGVFEFESIPLWLGLLWLGFVLTLGHSLAWLNNLPRIMLAPIGAIAGCLSYLAGWKFDAVGLPLGVMYSSLTLAICWGLMLPALVVLDNRIRRQA